ncbi:C2H2 finger domain-containing protein, variant 1 [Blastomyces dermatitidis ER-3]|uniref:C2H2 finger domain-containing protein, variant 1 n=2 Tax=Blastomyces TaxID=229219 RepID=A0A179UZW9_BLAGS|nr:C2H2 finger domain-containing protein, variant 1 [Blastomyces gilchristii SLH14081]XP_045281852.1 C2H2 finger domain-containing protein, variant 1 [Blastomyces dermatitidis ER-3]EQL31824.1 hypothetical protein, variant 1 [Blastomyces dermatitidis ATCC 26199]OAT02125.1 C2H2 finger domain-containing protein, variant 1 [Blastomyces dermatitidis ER-3]OAT13390.1 C2H2 finger domain-containing protein, variant 1 [Blastomyces gilchristii SLH14081]
MGTALDALNSHQSLTSRRPAANNLPGFELLHPQVSQSQKYSHPSSTNAQQPSRVGSLLTPPSNTSSDASSISAYVSHSSVSSSQTAPSYSQGYWPQSNSFGTGRNNSNSPTTADTLTPSYDINQRAYFQTPIPGASTSSGPSPTTQQPQQAMAHVLMNAQATTATVPPTPPAQNNVDAYGQKLPSTPLYSGSHQSTPQQATFPPYQSSGSSAIHHSGTNGPSSRISPIQAQMQGEGQHQLTQYSSRPYPSYSLPAMSGPIMTNVHHPNSQLALMGSIQPNLLPAFNSGHAAAMSSVFSGHPNHIHGLMQHPPPDDRPYRCDQCTQSFRRNHDLKRHKRIHLAVKPYPCDHCAKSFSRKDALKRHILVKGCDKDKDSQSDKNSTTASSPVLTRTDNGTGNSASGRTHNIQGNHALKSHT